MSSLTAQLAGIKTNSNATILDKSKRKKTHTVSLVFEPKEAAQQDFESIYYVCIDKFREMELIDSRYSKFAKTLFSDTSIRFDRQVQDPEHVDGLNYTIKQFFMLNAAYLHLTPAVYCLEWLVRRFQVHLLNTEDLILSSLSSYQLPEFLRILDVVPVASFPPMFKFLLSCKQNNQNPSRNTMVRILSSDKNIFQVLNAYFEQLVTKELEFNRYTVFWSSALVWVLMAYKEKNDVSVLDMILPCLSNLVVVQKPNIQIATYTIFVVLCSQFSLSQQISDAIITTITKTWTKASRAQGVACISQLVRYSDERTGPFAEDEWAQISGVPNVDQEVINLAKTHSVAAFAVRYVLSLLEYVPNQVAKILPILESANLSPVQLHIVAMRVLQTLNSRPVELVEWLLATHSDEFKKCLDDSKLSMDQLELALQTSLSMPQPLAEVAESQEQPAVEPVQAGPSKEDIINESANLAQSKADSFLALESIKGNASRIELWLKASTCRKIHEDELLALMRLAPSSEPSFLVSVAISTLPVLSRQKALELFSKRVATGEGNFQMLLPCVLALLADPSLRMRRAAATALKALEACTGKPWGTTTVYGQSNELKSLSKSELKSVFKHFDSCIEECVLDNHQISKLIDGVGKTSWIEFLTNHAMSAQIPPLLTVLLQGLSGHKGVTKGLEPLFTSWIANRANWQSRCEMYRFDLPVLEQSVVKVVGSNEKTGIAFLESALVSAEPLAEVTGKHLVSIWAGLKPEVQNALFSRLIDVAVDNSSEFDPSNTLHELPLDGANFAEALNLYKPKNDATETKRRRRRSSSTQPLSKPVNEIELHLRKVTILLELLEVKIETMQNPMLVFGGLFDVLNELVNLSGSQIPVLFTQGLVASCLILLLDKNSKKLSKDSLGAIRVDVLVNCIRTSTNPQIQNKFLLLIASLASICPDLVFHSVMPIFTFMGANTVRLDNDYSAFVIQQTISKVIPALVQNGDKVEEIEIALRSFVAAFPHIPRHRRNKLFGALVKTLGPNDSLHKLLLLLGQKYAELQNRKKTVEAKATVHFATPFLRSFSINEQLQAVSSYIAYVDEPQGGLLKSDEAEGDELKQQLYEFLAVTFGSDVNITGTQPLYVQINAAGALDDANLALCSSMIQRLLRVEGNGPAHLVLSACLELLPTSNFVTVVTELANNEVPDLKLRVLQLVERKFELDSHNKDAALAAVTSLHANLKKPDSVAKNEVIDAMDSIFSRISLAPELQLEFLDTLCECILSEDIDLQVSAVNAINTISRNIGARIISHFPKILPVLFAKCKSTLSSSDRDSDNSRVLQQATIALVSGLIVRIPTFMGSCIGTVLELVLTSNIDIKPREDLLQLVGRKIDPQTVISAYISSWDAASNSVESINLFFRNLDVLVEETTKKLVGTRASQLFGMLLECFGVRSLQRFSVNEVNHIETVAVSSAVKIVLKLNDKVFRPQFLRMVRWAFEGEGGSMVAGPLRQVVFMKFVVKLLGQLKSIVTNYYGYILDHVCGALESKEDDYSLSHTIVKLIYQSLILSFGSDSDDFWQSASRFTRIKTVLLGQIKPEPVHGSLLVKAIVALAECSSSQEHRKEINDGLAKNIVASAPSGNKIWATRVLSALYVKLGEEWVTSLPQLVPLIAELLDDDDELVESEVRTHLVPVIEDVLGESMDRYLS